MSEMRQRKSKEEITKEAEDNPPRTNEEAVKFFQEKMWDAMEEKVRKEAPKGTSEVEIRKMVDEQLGRVFEPKKKPLPGLKHETKAIKDNLTKDPYNLHLIFELGQAYVEEGKEVEACNVLVRGWKRMSEFELPEQRFVYLLNLCACSIAANKHKQALAVLLDIEEPVEGHEYMCEYSRMACKVYANNGNMQKSLKAFSNAIGPCAELDEALPIWIDCMIDLKKVGAFDAAKSSLERLAKTEEDKKRITAAELIQTLRDGVNQDRQADTVIPLPVKIALGVSFLLTVVYLLHLLESTNLATLKLGK